MDREALGDLFNQYDSNKSGSITLDELETMLSHLGVGKLIDCEPLVDPEDLLSLYIRSFFETTPH